MPGTETSFEGSSAVTAAEEAARNRELNRSKIPTPEPKPARRLALAAPPDVFKVRCSKCKSANALLSQYASCALLSVLSSTAPDIPLMSWSNKPVRSSSNDFQCNSERNVTQASTGWPPEKPISLARATVARSVS